MDVILEAHAKNFLGDKAWTFDAVMRVGADLAQAVNKMDGLTGVQKTELVCQTILKMLDDAVKFEKERTEESIETEKTIKNLEECKKIVKELLPVTLSLLVAASRGKILLQKAKKAGCFSCFSGEKKEKKQEKQVQVVEQKVVPRESIQNPVHAGQSDLLEQVTPQVILRSPEGTGL